MTYFPRLENYSLLGSIQWMTKDREHMWRGYPGQRDDVRPTWDRAGWHAISSHYSERRAI